MISECIHFVNHTTQVTPFTIALTVFPAVGNSITLNKWMDSGKQQSLRINNRRIKLLSMIL